MRCIKTLSATALSLLLATSAFADDVQQKLGPDGAAKPAVVEPLLLKDPFIAEWMSGTMPGLGQWYCGKRARGFAFFVATIGAAGATYGFAKPAVLEIRDYDLPENGGNADGILSVTEAQNWQDHEFQGSAFERLSNGRKVGAITSGVAALGFYIWNIVDAGRTAREHNRRVTQRRLSLGLDPDPARAALALNLSF